MQAVQTGLFGDEIVAVTGQAKLYDSRAVFLEHDHSVLVRTDIRRGSHPKMVHLGVAEFAGTDSGTAGGKFADVRGNFASGRPQTTARDGITLPTSFQFKV